MSELDDIFKTSLTVPPDTQKVFTAEQIGALKALVSLRKTFASHYADPYGNYWEVGMRDPTVLEQESTIRTIDRAIEAVIGNKLG